MKRVFLPLALAITVADLGASTVDLTPRYVESDVDGYKTRKLHFLDGSKKIGIGVDQETTVSTDGSGVVFKFPKFPDAGFRIATSPLSPEDSMSDASALERYRAAAKTWVPAGATEVQILEEVAGPLPINRWQSHRFVISYQAGAYAMKQSVTFLTMNPTTQLALVTTASTRNFAEAAERSFQIIRTWHEMLPGDELPDRGN